MLSLGILGGFSLVPAQALTVVKGTVVGKDGWLFLVWDDPRKVDLKPMGQVVDVIGSAVRMFKAAGIDTVITLVPSKTWVYRDFLPDEMAITADSNAERRYGMALAALRGTGAVVPDMRAAFVKLRQASPNERLWYKTDTHWTAWAAEHAAAETAAAMAANLKLPKASKPGAKLGPAVTKNHSRSDLALNLPADQRAAYPDEDYVVHLPPAATGQALLAEDESADVVVVGSSYMQPKYNFAPALSAQLNRPVALQWQVHTYGPYETMLRYLKSDLFKKQRPKAIVWSFLEGDIQVMPDNKLAWLENAMPSQAFLAGVKGAVS